MLSEALHVAQRQWGVRDKPGFLAVPLAAQGDGMGGELRDPVLLR